MKFVRRLSGGVMYIERTLVITMLGVMVLLAFAQVMLRNLFSTGFLWADPLLRHLVLWLGFLGASLATQEEKHISIDVITRYTSARTTQYIRLLTNLFAAGVCFFMMRAGWIFLLSEKEVSETLLTIGEREFPTWWFQLVIPLGFALLSFRFVLKIIELVGVMFTTTLPTTHEKTGDVII